METRDPKKDQHGLFASKDNKARQEKYASGVNYNDYNLSLIIQEFIGHKLYSLVVESPKTYITYDDDGKFYLNSAIHPDSMTLRDYFSKALDIDKINDGDFLNPAYHEKLEHTVHHLKGIGPLCFMALLLQDDDVFGRNLDNVLVVDDKVIKIDASEINLEPMKDYHTRLLGLLNEYKTDKPIHFFMEIFKRLSDKQREEGLSSLKVFSKKLSPLFDWLDTRIPNDFTPHKIELAARIKTLLTACSVESDRPIPLTDAYIDDTRDYKQNRIIRSANDFVSTQKKFEGGNSTPEITRKDTQKERISVLMYLKTMVESLIFTKKVKNTQATLLRLNEFIDGILTKQNIKNKDIIEISKQYKKLPKALLDQMPLVTLKFEKYLETENVKLSDIVKVTPPQKRF